MYKNKESINYLDINQTIDNENDNNIDLNDNIEGYNEIDSLEDTETGSTYSLKEEIKRVFHFYKEQPSIIVIVIFITYLLYYSFKNNSLINNVKNIKKINMKGGSEEYDKMKSSIFELFINTKLWNSLKKQHNYDNNILNKIIVIFGYIFLGFIVRPIKGFFYVLMILMGISGSFLFPFLIFGVMLYYIFKKIIFNKKPNID
jgi:hypothetical protein